MPDNCCGNGCKTCVWDIYFQELEEYNKLYSQDNIQKLSSDKAEQPGETAPKQKKEEAGEKRNELNELDHPLLNTLNDSPHEESHVEGNEGRVHHYSGETEGVKAEAKPLDLSSGKSEDKQSEKPQQAEIPTNKSQHYKQYNEKPKQATEAPINKTNDDKQPKQTTEQTPIKEDTQPSNTEPWNKYLGYHHPSKTADPYLYRLYYGSALDDSGDNLDARQDNKQH